jgi:hypothetical protein
MAVTFDGSGRFSFVYEEAENVLGEDVELMTNSGDSYTERASHVEPSRVAKGLTELSVWTADMGPVGGPILGPFGLRREALKAERDWLRDERGL